MKSTEYNAHEKWQGFELRQGWKTRKKTHQFSDVGADWHVRLLEREYNSVRSSVLKSKLSKL